MELELIIFLVALVVVLAGGAIGWLFGGAGVIRYLLATLFATLVALRFWYPATENVGPSVSFDPLYLAGGMFLALFLAAFILAGFAARIKATRFLSVLSDPLDKILGVLFGLAMGILLGGALLLDLSFFCAGAKGEFDAAKFPVRLDKTPIAFFTIVESRVAGVPDSSKTVFAVIKAPSSSGDAAAKETRVTLGWD